MSLKKILKRSETGQVFLEYFILFALIAALAIIGASPLVTQTQKTAEEFTNRAVNELMPVDI